LVLLRPTWVIQDNLEIPILITYGKILSPNVVHKFQDKGMPCMMPTFTLSITPNSRTSKYGEPKLLGLKFDIEKYILVVGNFKALCQWCT
jgi:hypothetical protein